MSEPDDIVGKTDSFLGRRRPGKGGDVPVLTDVVDARGVPLSEAQLRGIEREVTQRVLEAIQPALSGLLEQALGALTEQYKAQAEAIVREAVARALEREIQRLRSPGG
jgi:hypothetical protein